MIVLAIILGCIVGFSISYMLIGFLVLKSNNHGDSKGTFDNFNDAPLHIIRREDGIRRP